MPEPVNSSPGWFGDGPRHLFGWLHTPSSGVIRGAAVLCPPLQTDYYASYTTYRTLATRLAQAGLAALRFDYTATGDSPGYPNQVAGIDAWLDDIDAAVDLLVRRGAKSVVTVGMRIGATLAAAQARRAGSTSGAVLWDPCTDGRTFLRQSSLLLRQGAEITGVALPPGDDDAFDLIGYDFPPTLGAQLAALRIDDGFDPGPCLLLSRTGSLPSRLRSWSDRPQLTVTEAAGQPELLEVPFENLAVPHRAVDTVVDWCRSQAHPPVDMVERNLAPSVEVPAADGSTVTETVWCHEDPDLFGIQAGPEAQRAGFAVMFNTGGAQPRSGNNRLHVELARDLAAQGVHSLRFDLPGIGDSPPAPGQSDRVFAPEAIPALLVALHQTAPAGVPTVAVGLCSGGYHALEVASALSVAGVFGVHPTFEFGVLSGKSHLDDPRRKVWVSDRAWLSSLDRQRVSRTLKWRAPAWVWKLLDKTRMQPDITKGAFLVAERGTDVVLSLEGPRLDGPRMRRIRDARVPGLSVVRSSADHSLIDVAGRRQVAAQIREWVADMRSRCSAGVDG